MSRQLVRALLRRATCGAPIPPTEALRSEAAYLRWLATLSDSALLAALEREQRLAARQLTDEQLMAELANAKMEEANGPNSGW